MSDTSHTVTFEKGQLTAFPKESLVHYNGEHLHLPSVLMKMFACLLNAHPRAVHRKEIRDELWGGTSVGDNSVDQTIKRLNLKLVSLGLEVKNEPSIGFRIASTNPSAGPYAESDASIQPSAHIDISPETSTSADIEDSDLEDVGSLPIYTRAELDRAVGSIEDRFDNVQEEVWISGNDNQFIAVALSGFMLDLLRRGRTVRLMGVDPESAAGQMLALIDPRFEGNTFKREVDHVTEAVAAWYKAFPRQFEYKLLPILPALGFFITDPRRSNQTVKVELYTAKPWGPLKSRPHLVLSKNTPSWQEYFIRQFENYWALSRSPF